MENTDKYQCTACGSVKPPRLLTHSVCGGYLILTLVCPNPRCKHIGRIVEDRWGKPPPTKRVIKLTKGGQG